MLCLQQDYCVFSKKLTRYPVSDNCAVKDDLYCVFSKKLTVDQFINNILPALAQHRVIESKKAKNPGLDDPAVKEELEKLMKKISAKYHEWISADVSY